MIIRPQVPSRARCHPAVVRAPVWVRGGGLAIGMALGMAATAEASRSINFGSTLNATNLQSDGSPMDVTFTFELGVFSDFVPQLENIDLWTADWTALQDSAGNPAAAPYDSSPLFPGASVFVNNFEGTAQIIENVSDPGSPYAPGSQAYIWGFTSREVGVQSEWILLTNAAWILPVVPDDGMPSPFSLDFAVSDAGTVATVGSVNPDYATAGDTPHLVSARVVPQAVPAPEPASALLVLIGAGTLLARRRWPAAPTAYDPT